MRINTLLKAYLSYLVSPSRSVSSKHGCPCQWIFVFHICCIRFQWRESEGLAGIASWHTRLAIKYLEYAMQLVLNDHAEWDIDDATICASLQRWRSYPGATPGSGYCIIQYEKWRREVVWAWARVGARLRSLHLMRGRRGTWLGIAFIISFLSLNATFLSQPVCFCRTKDTSPPQFSVSSSQQMLAGWPSEMVGWPPSGEATPCHLLFPPGGEILYQLSWSFNDSLSLFLWQLPFLT